MKDGKRVFLYTARLPWQRTVHNHTFQPAMFPDLSGQKTADLFQAGRSCSPHLLQDRPSLKMAKHRRYSNFKINVTE